jgi:MFS family permease
MSISMAVGERAAPGRQFAALGVIMAGLSAQSLIFSVPPPVLPAMARALGADGAWVAQLVFVLPSLGLMLAGLASGWVVARAGLRRSLVAAVLVYGAMGSLPVVSASVPVLLASRFLLGAGCAVLSTGCTMLLAQSYTGEARARLLGFQAGAGSLAGLAALVLSGALGGILGWHVPFALYGVTALPVLFVLRAGCHNTV